MLACNIIILSNPADASMGPQGYGIIFTSIPGAEVAAQVADSNCEVEAIRQNVTVTTLAVFTLLREWFLSLTAALLLQVVGMYL